MVRNTPNNGYSSDEYPYSDWDQNESYEDNQTTQYIPMNAQGEPDFRDASVQHTQAMPAAGQRRMRPGAPGGQGMQGAHGTHGQSQGMHGQSQGAHRGTRRPAQGDPNMTQMMPSVAHRAQSEQSYGGQMQGAYGQQNMGADVYYDENGVPHREHRRPRTQKEIKAERKAQQKAAKAEAKALKKANKKKMPLPLKIGIIVASVVVAIGLALVIGVTLFDKFLEGGKSSDEMASIKESMNGSGSLTEPFYMLLIGSDEREGNSSYGQRSDSVILARIDPVDYVVTLVSIQRDIKMEDGKGGSYKFNAEYASGGASRCISAAQKMLDVDISHYAEVNFSAFTNIVDAVGGIDVYIGQTIDDWWAGDQVIQEGWQHLDGTQALIVARARHYGDDDYTRSNYQRTIIQTLINKILSLPVTDLPKVLASVSGCISTDLKSGDIFSLAMAFKDASDIKMYSADLPSSQANIDGVSYVILDEVDTKTMLELIDKGADPNSINLKTSGVMIGTRIEAKAGQYDDNGNLINGN